MGSMQLPLIGALLALLVLLLVLRTVGRRRAGRADRADDVAARVEDAVAGPVEDGAAWPAATEADAELHLDAPVEAPVEAPAALDSLLEPEPSIDLQERTGADEAVADSDDAGDPVEAAEAEEPVPPRRRRLFGRKRREKAPAEDFVGELAFEPVLEPGADAALGPVDAVAAGAVSDETASTGTAEGAAATDDAEAAETPEQELKALREQLRALELVVQQQSADHPTAALAKVEETVAEQSAAYLRQVSLVVSGLAAHTSEDENPRRTLARVAAAVERLGVPNSMERPILPVSHELTSRHHDDSRPSHLRQPQELDAAADSGPAPTRVTDVFAGLDAATPAAPVAPVHPPAPTAGAGAGVAEPLLPQPAPQPGPQAEPQAEQPLLPAYQQPPAPPLPDATAVMPVFGQPTGNVHDLSSLAAYDGGHESGYDGGYDPAAEGGIPAFEEPPAVLPVPPPASAEPTGRRARRSKSGSRSTSRSTSKSKSKSR